jgi:hypothetical protein
MANLIITIISIALVAVAAIMGAYYGGTAFLEGQAKARANAIINKAQQIGAAWILYTSTNGGARDITPWSSLVTGSYLQSTPINDFQPTAAAITGWDLVPYGLSDGDFYSNGNTFATTNHDTLVAEINDNKTCLAIHRMSAGASATLSDVAGGDPISAGSATITASNGKFDCLLFARGSSDDQFLFIYRVF